MLYEHGVDGRQQQYTRCTSVAFPARSDEERQHAGVKYITRRFYSRTRTCKSGLGGRDLCKCVPAGEFPCGREDQCRLMLYYPHLPRMKEGSYIHAHGWREVENSAVSCWNGNGRVCIWADYKFADSVCYSAVAIVCSSADIVGFGQRTTCARHCFFAFIRIVSHPVAAHSLIFPPYPYPCPTTEQPIPFRRACDFQQHSHFSNHRAAFKLSTSCFSHTSLFSVFVPTAFTTVMVSLIILSSLSRATLSPACR